MTMIVDLETHSEQHVTVAELARYWRVTDRAVQYLVTKGALPAIRVGRAIRIKTEDARRFGRIDDVITGPVASAN
jgi:excisionase family DNA binding protein